MKIAPIENWEAFMLPPVCAALATWTKRTQDWTTLVHKVVAGKAMCLAGSNTPDKVEALSIIVWPEEGDPFYPLPLVHHFHCNGGAKLRAKMVRATVAFLHAHGYTAFTAINVSGAPVEVWARAFSDAGFPHPIATVYEFKKDPYRGNYRKNAVRRKRAETAKHVHAAGDKPKHVEANRHDARRASGAKKPVRPVADPVVQPVEHNVARPVRGKHGTRRGTGPKRSRKPGV